MERQVITANGNYTFSCPIGATFAFAASGTFDFGVITAQYNSGMTTTSGTDTLTIGGVVIHGETVTIGEDIYRFAADAAQTVEPGNIPVDITAAAIAAQGKLTIAAQPTAGDTMVVGDKTYTFVASGTASVDGEISVGTSLATAKAAIIGALKNEDGRNIVNEKVSCADAFAGNDLVLTAKIAGVIGNNIETTSSFTSVSNFFDGVTLGTITSGVDCTAAAAITALVAADAGTSYTLSDGAGDTVVVTGNGGFDDIAIVTTTDMVNGSFAAGTLTGGTDPLDRWKPFATTAIALNAAGEKTGVNVGAHNEINLNMASIASAANIVVVFNVLP